MILVDSSVWIDHLNKTDPQLSYLLDGAEVITHPFVIGEILLGNLRNRQSIRQFLLNLLPAIVAKDFEVYDLIEKHKLFGLGVGYIDVHILASAKLSNALIWTRDLRLRKAADTMGIAI